MKLKHFEASKIITLLFSVLVLLASFKLQVVIVQAAPETVVKVDPYARYAIVGETFVINVTVVDVQNLYGVVINLYWDSSLLNLVSVDVRLGEADGVLYNPFYIAENSIQEGKYTLAVTSISSAPSFSGSGNIVRATFNATSSGGSVLNLEAELWDFPPPDRDPPISEQIEHITVDGFVNVEIPEISNTFILVIFMIFTTFAAVLLRSFQRKVRLIYDSVLNCLR